MEFGPLLETHSRKALVNYELNQKLGPFPTCAHELNHLDATAVAHFDFGHVVVADGVVERIVTTRVLPTVAFETLDRSLC